MACTPNHLLIELGVSRRKEGREIMGERETCGCELSIQEVDGHLDWQAFKFCPMHKAAPNLLEALELFVAKWPAGRISDETLALARTAIEAAKS